MSEVLPTTEKEKINPLWMRTENNEENPFVIAGKMLSSYGIGVRSEVDPQDGHLLLFVSSEDEKRATVSLSGRRDFQLLREAYQGRGVMEESFLRDLTTVSQQHDWDENDTASLLAYYYQNAEHFKRQTSQIASLHNHKDLAEQDRNKADDYHLKYEALSSLGIEHINQNKLAGFIGDILNDHFPPTR